jgi:hypothetical protein
MNDLETRLRRTLDERAGDPGTRRMPPGTMGRLRRRQARSVGAGLVLGVAAVLVAAGVLRILPRGGEGVGLAGGPLVAPSHPIEDVPHGWPRVDVMDPADAPHVIRPAVADAIGSVDVLASGSVAGAEFSFMGWFGGREEDGVPGPCFGFAGPWSGGTPPTDPVLQGFGGIVSSTCSHWRYQLPVPTAADLHLSGQRDTQNTPGIAANYGVVSGRVARLQVRLEDGSTSAILILEGPESWGDVRAFLFFPPAAKQGTLTAFDREGRALARADICEATYEGASGGCGGPVEQLADPPSEPT